MEVATSIVQENGGGRRLVVCAQHEVGSTVSVHIDEESPGVPVRTPGLRWGKQAYAASKDSPTVVHEEDRRRRTPSTEIPYVDVDVPVAVYVGRGCRVAEPGFDREILTRVGEPSVRRGKRERVQEAGKGRGVVAVVGDEYVVAPVTIEVGDDDLPTVLSARNVAREEGAAISEPSASVTEEYADRDVL
jgi:hypothetical protein